MIAAVFMCYRFYRIKYSRRIKVVSSELKNVVIIGASSGIGKEMTLNYARRGGYNLILVARRKEELMKIAKLCTDVLPNMDALNTPKVFIYVANMCDTEAIFGCAQFCGMKFQNSVDILVLSAGVMSILPFNELASKNDDDSSSIIETIFNANVIGPIKTTKAFLGMLKHGKGGRIIVISSAAGKNIFSNSSCFTSTYSDSILIN
jgi:short-subunit dehydrogenase